jgi:hypothetical protein
MPVMHAEGEGERLLRDREGGGGEGQERMGLPARLRPLRGRRRACQAKGGSRQPPMQSNRNANFSR